MTNDNAQFYLYIFADSANSYTLDSVIITINGVDYSPTTYALTQGTGTITAENKYYYAVLTSKNASTIVSPLYGKSWMQFGDSITDSRLTTNTEKYWKQIGEKYNMTIYNYGVSSSGYNISSSNTNETSVWGTDNKIIDQINRATESPDFITVFAGTNDWGLWTNNQLGTFDDIADYTNLTSIYAMIYKTLLALKTKFYDKKILIITPTPRCADGDDVHKANSRGFKLVDVRNAIVSMCEYLSMDYLDLTLQSGLLFPEAKDIYTSDGLHLNANGHTKITPKIVNKMEVL